jgi:2-dehydro-3-deoxygluconokinase
MSARILCYGELLLRLSAPGRERLLQTPQLQVHVGGAEANVAVSLARFGHDARIASVVPDDALGEGAVAELRRHGVDTRAVLRERGRMGLYFLAAGALHRPAEVLYDRAGSAFARAPLEQFDWSQWLSGVNRLHLSGVTPALGEVPAQAAIRAARAARAAGVPVSFDGNYRASLWQAWHGDAPALLRQVIEHADVLFADHRDIELVLGLHNDGATAEERFAQAAAAAIAAFPRLGRLCATQREVRSVDRQRLSAWMATREGGLHAAPAVELEGIVDRIGAGDAFAAGVLHGLHSGMADADSLAFGWAAACLKHSIPGDFNLASAAEVTAMLAPLRVDVRR